MFNQQKHTIRQGENGYALLFVIIAVTVGVLVMTPVLTYLSSSLSSAERSLTQTEYRLTRESGAEYAIARLKNDRTFLTSLSSQALVAANVTLPSSATNNKTVSSLTATLLTPSQWDLVELPANHESLYASLSPVAIPGMQPEDALDPPLVNEQTAISPFNKGGLKGILSHLFMPPPQPRIAMSLAPVATITKTVSPGQVAPGGQVTYTINVTNTGDQTAVPTFVRDTLPSSSGFSYVTGSTTGNITANPTLTSSGRVLTWSTVPTIAPGASMVFSFGVITGSSTGTFYDEAEVRGNFSTVNTGSTAPVAVGPSMRVVKTVDNATPGASTNVTYTITVYNDTASTNATLTQVRDTLPAGFSYVNNSTTGNITANPSITAQVNLTWSGTWTVVGGGSFTFSFKATTTSDWGTFFNNVSISGSNFPDASSGQTATTTVGSILITKTVNNPTPSPQEAVTYSVTVRNVGSTNVTITKITDDIPNTFTYVTGSTSGNVTGNPSQTGNVLTWQGAGVPSSIAPSTNFTFSFQTTVPDTPDTYYDESKIYVTNLGNNFIITTGPTAAVNVVTQARIVISESSGDRSGPPGWSSVNVKGYGFAPNKEVRLYWVDLNNSLNPTTAPPTGTWLSSSGTIITLSSSYAPLSFSAVSVTIPSNANWGTGLVVAVMLDGSNWVEQDRKPFNVRAKYEISSVTADGNTLTARVAFTGARSADGTFSVATNTPVMTVYTWKE